jgi:dGTPase
VYMSHAQVEHQRGAIKIIRALVDYLLEHPSELPASFRQTNDQLVVQVSDYVAGMTDRFALSMHDRLFSPGAGG